jgi:hypothetical protein
MVSKEWNALDPAHGKMQPARNTKKRTAYHADTISRHVDTNSAIGAHDVIESDRSKTMSESRRFVATDEQRRNDPLLSSAHAAGLSEREVIELLHRSRLDMAAMVHNSLMTTHSVSMFVCKECATRVTYTGPTAKDFLTKP